MMKMRFKHALEPEIYRLGDHHPLVQQLGFAEGLHELSGLSKALEMPPVRDFETLRRFLKTYQARVLMPIELPAIHQAYLHAAANRTRELVELDRKLGTQIPLEALSSASRRVGQVELRRLRPLRDVRVLQRFLAAVDAGEAQGWHTMVFGLTLAIYSVPLRQGLLGYAQQVMLGYIHSAGARFSVSMPEIEELMTELNAPLPMALGSLLFLEGLEA